jgi:hypothetical protein
MPAVAEATVGVFVLGALLQVLSPDDFSITLGTSAPIPHPASGQIPHSGGLPFLRQDEQV